MFVQKTSILSRAVLLSALIAAAGCSSKPSDNASNNPVPPDARAIAKEAYVYGFPMAANYLTMYKQAIDTTSRDYRAPYVVPQLA